MSGNKKNKMENMTERKDGVSKEKNFKGKDFMFRPNSNKYPLNRE